MPVAGERVALVTGAASGIGAATAELLTARGMSVLCADLDLAGAEAVARRLPPATRSSAVRLDVGNESDWDALVTSPATAHGRLDVLVHAAGISEASPLSETALESWRRVMRVNLDGTFLAVRHGIRSMSSSGGAIVVLGSASGIRAASGAAAYSTSKAAVGMLVRAAAKECRDGQLPIRINVVSPAGVKTPMWQSMPFFRDLVQQHGSEDAAYAVLAGPGGRFAEPSEVAECIAYLVSDEARHITGVEVPIDGGYLL